MGLGGGPASLGLPHSRPSHQELAARPWQFSELSGCVAPPLAVVSPFAGEPPLGNQATPEDPPTSALPHSPPEWSLGGMTGRNCSRASPSQPQEPTSSSTLLISFCPPGKGGKKARHLGSRSMFVPSSAVKRFGEESFAGRYVSAAPDYPSPFTGIKSYCSDVHPLA